MSDTPPVRGRGRAPARRRGQPAQGQPPPRTAPSVQPVSQPAPQTAPAPAPVTKARGRAVSATSSSSLQAPAKLRGPSIEPPSEQLRATTISESVSTLPIGDAPQRGGNEGARGACRQRPLELVTRPSTLASKQGKHGVPAVLKGNYFSFQSLTDWTLYQYRVDFEPDEERTIVRKAFLKPHKPELGPYIFDGTVLYTVTRLKKDPLEVFTKRTIDDTNVRVIIKKTTDLVMGDFHYLQVLNIILRKVIGSLNLQLVGRDYYDPQRKVELREYNLEIWPGYTTSIRQHEHSILLNADVSSKVMRNETALDLLMECRDRSPSDWKDVFETAMVGATVITRYNNQTYRVDDIDYDSTPLKTFDMKGTEVTFLQYYKQKYNLNISNSNQPLLVSRPKAKDIRGGRSNNVILVPELCCLTGITDSMRSNFQLMRAMDTHTRIRPAARIEKLERGFMGRINETKAAQEELTLWNVKFNPTLLTFPGRNFPPENIVHGGGRESTADREADFTKNLIRQSMLESGNLDCWVCIYPRRVCNDIERFVQTLSKSANSLRFTVPEPAWEEIPDDRSGTYVEAIERAINRYQPKLVMCILMNNKADRYEAIKKKCCVDRAIPSQVVLAKNLTSKGVMSICTKIAIQINCKIGGSPWSVHVPFKRPVMIVGFDVTHDTRMKGRSVGGLVASLNQSYSRYFSAVSMHTNGEELSNDIAIQMTKAVIKFREINQEPPTKIIFYRDGVGDGNINYVLTNEVELIKKALDQFYPDGGVKMAFVIVSKNINARIFQGNDNPPPGTIVDDVITLPERYDFFLVSQSVRQGTVSPTYYNVIYDSMSANPDLMQRLSYKMCHMYYNWSGTVRVPAPVQYAHKLSFLVGQSIHRTPNPNLENLLYFL